MLIGKIKILLSSFLILFSAQLHSHAKVDSIRLVNGNELTGEIKRLLRGKLFYGTSSMGTVEIEWADVTAVASGFHYEARLANGRRYYGSLGLADTAGDVRIVEADGEHVVKAIEIIELRPIDDSLEQRLDMRLGAGYSYTKASDVATLNLISELDYEDEKGINSLRGRTVTTDSDGESSDSNRYKVARQMWTTRPQVINWFDGSYEDNDELNLDYRYTVGFGLGRAIVDTNDVSLVGYVGLQGATEKDGSGEKLDSMEGVLGVAFNMWRFNTPELDLELNFTLYPGITESDRLRGNTDLRLSWELVEDLFWDITSWASYDDAGHSGSDTDYAITSGVSWKY